MPEKTTNIYNLPVPEEAITMIVNDNESHQGAYRGSVDFAVSLDTPVLAAAAGVIMRARDDSNKYGQEPSFGPDVNYITIEHPGGELSEYLHLAKDSVLVKPGEKVQVGQHIARTGLSGWLYAPHLHFMIYPKDEAFQCREISFVNPLSTIKGRLGPPIPVGNVTPIPTRIKIKGASSVC